VDELYDRLKNMKYAEVAELLGISVATVKTLLVRSLKTLRNIVSGTAFLLYVLVCRGKNKCHNFSLQGNVFNKSFSSFANQSVRFVVYRAMESRKIRSFSLLRERMHLSRVL